MPPVDVRTTAPWPARLSQNAGMHAGPIKEIGVDAACSRLATASDDKAVRIWSLLDGRLERDDPRADQRGKRRQALSPDARWLAAGGRESSWVRTYPRIADRASLLRDGVAAVGFNMMRELCGALPDQVLLSHKPPADTRPYRRFFHVPVRCRVVGARVFRTASSTVQCPAPIPASARSWRNRSRTIGRSLCPMTPTRSFEPCAPASGLAKSHWRRRRAGSRCVRALNRRLQAEGTTFRKLCNEAPFEVAVQLLQGTRIGVNEIALPTFTTGLTDPFGAVLKSSPTPSRLRLRYSGRKQTHDAGGDRGQAPGGALGAVGFVVMKGPPIGGGAAIGRGHDGR